jgi:regulator of sigma E protease
MNFLLAWLIFSFIAGAADPSATARIYYVEPDSPAAQAGLVGAADAPTADPVRTGDEILAVDGNRFPYFDGRTPVGYVMERPGERVTLTVRKEDGRVLDTTVQLRSREQLGPERGPLGIRASTGIGENLQRDPVSAVGVGWNRTVDASLLILRTLRDLFGQLDDPQVSGPIGIVGAVGAVRTELPPNFLLFIIGLLSANLAVVNALPFPPLDGGRVAIGLLRSIFGRRISLQAERATYLVGFVLLMAFLVWISYFDIQRLPGN